MSRVLTASYANDANFTAIFSVLLRLAGNASRKGCRLSSGRVRDEPSRLQPERVVFGKVSP
jgi:hypothetical protein